MKLYLLLKYNRLARWKEVLKNLEQIYLEIILKINGEQSEKNIMEKVAFRLENFS